MKYGHTTSFLRLLTTYTTLDQSLYMLLVEAFDKRRNQENDQKLPGSIIFRSKEICPKW